MLAFTSILLTNADISYEFRPPASSFGRQNRRANKVAMGFVANIHEAYTKPYPLIEGKDSGRYPYALRAGDDAK